MVKTTYNETLNNNTTPIHFFRQLQLPNSQIPNTQIPTPIDSATMYLTGTFKQYNPSKAFQINLQNANNGNAKAMNALAIQYTKGLGVDTNFTLAVYWYTQAANNNYTKALVNLGMLYKHKSSDSAGYSLACHYFNQALQVAEPSAFFAQGYMLYKGLGCTQSYTAALALFNQGIQTNQANCMYFKGLCYKFGYGVTANTDTANYYIDTAAKLGYKQANAELANSNTVARATKNITSHSTIGDGRGEADKLETRNEFERIEKTTNPIKLNGKFKGKMLQYDYSGKKLLAQIPIILKVATSNNIINGSIQFNNNPSIQLQAIQQGNQLLFSQTSIEPNEKRNKRATRNEKLIFKTATLNIETNNNTLFLTGSLQLFNTYTHETEKPINIKLSQQKTRNGSSPSPIGEGWGEADQRPVAKDLLVFPNPTNGSFTVTFNLTKTSPVKINIYNSHGQVVYTKIFGNLPQGNNNVPIIIPLGSAGIYTAKVTANSILGNNNSFTQSTAFIYEN